jgi:hypothetical protein
MNILLCIPLCTETDHGYLISPNNMQLFVPTQNTRRAWRIVLVLFWCFKHNGDESPWDELCLKLQSVPRSKHTPSVIKISQLMQYREIIAVCSEIHTKQINTVSEQNVELLNVKPGGT